MPRNILLTSLDALENDRVLRYYAVQNEFGFDYCEAAQRMEASVEYILSRFPVDEILVLGGDMPSENGDEKKSRRLKDASALFPRIRRLSPPSICTDPGSPSIMKSEIDARLCKTQ